MTGRAYPKVTLRIVSDMNPENDDLAISRIIPELCNLLTLDSKDIYRSWELSKGQMMPGGTFSNMVDKFLKKCEVKTGFMQRYEVVEKATKEPRRVLLFLINLKIAVDQKTDDQANPVTPANKSILRTSRVNGDFVDVRTDPVMQLAFAMFSRFSKLLSSENKENDESEPRTLERYERRRDLLSPIAMSTPMQKPKVQFNIEQITYHSPAPSVASSGSGEHEPAYKPIEIPEVVRQVLDAFNGHMGSLFLYTERGHIIEASQTLKRGLFEHKPNVKMQLREILYVAGIAKQLQGRVKGEYGMDVMARAFYFAVQDCCIAPFKESVTQLYQKFRDDPKSVHMIHLKFFAMKWGPRLQNVVDWINAAEERLNQGPRERRCGMQLLTDIIDPVLCCTPSITWHFERAEEISKRMYKCFHELIKNWLLNGELNEFNEEFMIYCDCSVSNDQAWNRRFKIYDALVPGLLLQYHMLTEKILSIGKAMWFLKESKNQHLYSSQWDEHCRLVAKIEPHYYFTSSDLHVLADILERLEEMGNSVLLEDLMEKYHFADHIHALKTHFMLTNVDFAVKLYEQMKYVIATKPSFGLHDAHAALRSAIESSGSWDYPFERCLSLSMSETLKNKFSDITLADMKFNFLYSPAAEFPIVRLILFNSLHRYNFIFFFTWNIFATRYTSINMTLEHTRLCKDLWRQGVPPEFCEGREQLKTLLNEFSLGFFTMNKFTAQLTFYVDQVVTKCSEEFICDLKEARSLDGVIKLHRAYIDEIFCNLCLDTSPLSPRIRKIIGCIGNFCKTYDAFTKQYGEEQERCSQIAETMTTCDETMVFELEEEDLRHDQSVGDIAMTFRKQIEELLKEYFEEVSNLKTLDLSNNPQHNELVRLLAHSH
ncbi:hypothetical protein L596_016128 [Steinernema carpocapsae]|uniref:Gamma-tubulin complex component n=1 Tax=Steinernema carpocapsae TaxID=34508 RepID=A0A4U5NH31_STECR|nr:hypothetical protein L596_016128 [Steinernema carpocapsae]